MNKAFYTFIAVLIVLSMAIAIVLLNPELRTKTKDQLTGGRKSLATETAPIFNDNRIFKVSKVKEKDRLYIEIFFTSKNEISLLQKIELPDSRNAFFTFQGEAKALALTNIDKDPILEIIAPTFDKEMLAHLNVYKWNKILNQFELVSSSESLEQ